MSERPVFEPLKSGETLVKKNNVEFVWFPGFAKEQKQRSIKSLHENAKKSYDYPQILEISTKSETTLGVRASAFNIKLQTQSGIKATVESFYQGSKVFKKGGPFTDIYDKNSIDAKKDDRIRTSGELIGFEFYGTKWGLNDYFYDWLYLNALLQNKDIGDNLMNYDAFTDIEFNPKKSYNCQAYSAALFKAASHRDFNLEEIKDPKKFRKMFPKEKLINFQMEFSF